MKQLAITFDDGPDPRYTGLLLDLLKEHQIPATFFVVATNAKNNPDLIHRMLAEHHQVAMHSYSHRHAWLSSYPYMKKDFQYSFEIMKELGCRPCCYRPPWGARNPFTGYFLKQYGLRLVLWDVMVQDKTEKTGRRDSAASCLNRSYRLDILKGLLAAAANRGPWKSKPSLFAGRPWHDVCVRRL